MFVAQILIILNATVTVIVSLMVTVIVTAAAPGNHFILRIGDEYCLDMGGKTEAYYCYNTYNNNQAFHGLVASDSRIISSSQPSQCLTVAPESPCISAPELCTSKRVKKGPPPLALPHFADVLDQVCCG